MLPGVEIVFEGLEMTVRHRKQENKRYAMQTYIVHLIDFVMIIILVSIQKPLFSIESFIPRESILGTTENCTFLKTGSFKASGNV